MFAQVALLPMIFRVDAHFPRIRRRHYATPSPSRWMPVSPAAAYDVSKQPSEQIPCCNDHDHSFNKLSRLRNEWKMCNDSPAICGDFLCYRAAATAAAASMARQPRQQQKFRASVLRPTYETTTSDYSYEAKLVAPREKSWQDLQACDGCPAKRSTISTKCHITAQPPQALSRHRPR